MNRIYEAASDWMSYSMWSVMEHRMLLTDSDAIATDLNRQVKEVVKWPVEIAVHGFEDILFNDLVQARHLPRRFA